MVVKQNTREWQDVKSFMFREEEKGGNDEEDAAEGGPGRKVDRKAAAMPVPSLCLIHRLTP